MSAPAKLQVTTGPDRGKSFDLVDELCHIGRAADNQVVLTDPELDPHQASIVHRQGRFAIFTPLADVIHVEGTVIPAEKWVWLPPTAEVQLSRRTVLKFEQANAAGPIVADDAAARLPGQETMRGKTLDPVAAGAAIANPKGSPRGAGGKSMAATVNEDSPETSRARKGTAGRTEHRKTAKFLTEGPGGPLVRLGEDGHLPELALAEGKAGDAQTAAPKSTNPVVVVAAVIGSFTLSLLMIFLDAGSGSSASRGKAAARQEIMRFYGKEGQSPRPYQVHLRQARQAWSRADYGREAREYRKVLALLRAEGTEKTFSGVTGNRDDDRKLEELIATLLAE